MQGDSLIVCYLRDVRSALELRSLATGVLIVLTCHFPIMLQASRCCAANNLLHYPTAQT